MFRTAVQRVMFVRRQQPVHNAADVDLIEIQRIEVFPVSRAVESAVVQGQNSVGAGEENSAARSSSHRSGGVVDVPAVVAVVGFVPQAVASEEIVIERAVDAEGSLRMALVAVQHFGFAAVVAK